MVKLKKAKSFSMIEILIAMVIIITIFSIGMVGLNGILAFLMNNKTQEYIESEVILNASESSNGYIVQIENEKFIELSNNRKMLVRLNYEN